MPLFTDQCLSIIKDTYLCVYLLAGYLNLLLAGKDPASHGLVGVCSCLPSEQPYQGVTRPTVGSRLGIVEVPISGTR